jgi:hypothetical protein
MLSGLLWTIIVILFIAWLVCFLVAHITSPLIHLLLAIAVILFIWNLVTGRSTAV